MYVCICKSVTDSQIRDSILEGAASSIEDVQQLLGVSTQCGGCEMLASDVVDSALAMRDAGLSEAPHRPDLAYAIAAR